MIHSGGGESVSWLGCIFVSSFDVRAELGW